MTSRSGIHRGHGRRVVVNDYPGDCAGCGREVAAGAGVAVRMGGSWLTLHRGCAKRRLPSARD